MEGAPLARRALVRALQERLRVITVVGKLSELVFARCRMSELLDSATGESRDLWMEGIATRL